MFALFSVSFAQHEAAVSQNLITIQYNIRLLTIADKPQLSLKIYTIAIHTNIST